MSREDEMSCESEEDADDPEAVLFVNVSSVVRVLDAADVAEALLCVAVAEMDVREAPSFDPDGCVWVGSAGVSDGVAVAPCELLPEPKLPGASVGQADCGPNFRIR